MGSSEFKPHSHKKKKKKPKLEATYKINVLPSFGVNTQRKHDVEECCLRALCGAGAVGSCAIQPGSHGAHMAVEHVKWATETEKLNLTFRLHLANLNSHGLLCWVAQLWKRV
jgi:hypothetical protein